MQRDARFEEVFLRSLRERRDQRPHDRRPLVESDFGGPDDRRSNFGAHCADDDAHNRTHRDSYVLSDAFPVRKMREDPPELAVPQPRMLQEALQRERPVSLQLGREALRGEAYRSTDGADASANDRCSHSADTNADAIDPRDLPVPQVAVLLDDEEELRGERSVPALQVAGALLLRSEADGEPNRAYFEPDDRGSDSADASADDRCPHGAYLVSDVTSERGLQGAQVTLCREDEERLRGEQPLPPLPLQAEMVLWREAHCLPYLRTNDWSADAADRIPDDRRLRRRACLHLPRGDLLQFTG